MDNSMDGHRHSGSSPLWTNEVASPIRSWPDSTQLQRTGRDDVRGKNAAETALLVRSELRCMEEKVSRQLQRLQEQNQRVVDMMLEPLDAKVAGLEAKIAGTDGHVAELSGGIQGLQQAVEMQVQRSDASELRLQRWRTGFETDMRARLEALRQSGAAQQALAQGGVTQQDLLAVADLLKRELSTLTGDAISRKAAELREELADSSGREEIAAAAESLRGELRRLSEALLVEPSNASRGDEACRQGLAELSERAGRGEKAQEELKGELRRLREEMRAQRGELVSRGDAHQIAQQIAHQTAQLACRPSEEQSVVVHELEQRVGEAVVRLEAFAGECGAMKTLTDTLSVVAETTTMRMEAIEQRQRSLRDEVRGGSMQDSRCQVVGEHHAADYGLLTVRLERLEQECLAGRVRSLELAVSGGSVATNEASQQLVTRVERLERLDQTGLAGRLQSLEQATNDAQRSLQRRVEALERSSAGHAPSAGSQNSRQVASAAEASNASPKEVKPRRRTNLAPVPEEQDVSDQDVSSQLAALWSAMAELAERAPAQSEPAQPAQPARPASAEVATAAAATECMIGAVRDALVAVSECRHDQRRCEQRLEEVTGEVTEVRGEWSQLRGRVAGCEKSIGELATAVAESKPGKVAPA